MADNEKIKVVLMDNNPDIHDDFRFALEANADISLEKSFCYPSELLDWLEQNKTEILANDFGQLVLLMDIRMDDSPYPRQSEMDGIKTAQVVRNDYPRVPLILYSMWDKPDYFVAIDKAALGTAFAVLKRDSSLASEKRFGRVIRMVVHGDSYVDPEIKVEIDLHKKRREYSPLHRLAGHEQKLVLGYIAHGLSNPEIASAMKKSTRWVEEQVKDIYQALELTNTSGGDMRRIRAAKMYRDDRVLRWVSQGDEMPEIQTQDRVGRWRPLTDVLMEEEAELDNARLVSSRPPYVGNSATENE